MYANPSPGIFNHGTPRVVKTAAATEMEQLAESEFVTNLMGNVLVKQRLEEQPTKGNVGSAWTGILGCQQTRCWAVTAVAVTWEEATMHQGNSRSVTRRVGSAAADMEWLASIAQLCKTCTSSPDCTSTSMR